MGNHSSIPKEEVVLSSRKQSKHQQSAHPHTAASGVTTENCNPRRHQNRQLGANLFAANHGVSYRGIVPAQIPAHNHHYGQNQSQYEFVSHVQKMNCPLTKIFNKCTWKCDYTSSEEMTKQITKHMRFYHPQHCKHFAGKENVITRLFDGDRNVFFNCINNVLFLINLKTVPIGQSEKVVFINCQIVGSSAAEWKFAILFYNRSGDRSLRYEDICQQDLEPFDERNSCAEISAEFLESFQENGELMYKFYFTKLTGPQKKHWKRA